MADALIEAGHNVVIFDDLSGGFEDNVNPAATFVKSTPHTSQNAGVRIAALAVAPSASTLRVAASAVAGKRTVAAPNIMSTK